MSPFGVPRATLPDGAGPVGEVMRVGPVAAIPHVMAELGIDAESVFSRLRVSLREFADPNTRLPIATLAELAHEAATIGGCPHFGLLAGDRARLGSFGSIGSLMRHSARVADALRAFVLKFHMASARQGAAFARPRSRTATVRDRRDADSGDHWRD